MDDAREEIPDTTLEEAGQLNTFDYLPNVARDPDPDLRECACCGDPIPAGRGYAECARCEKDAHAALASKARARSTDPQTSHDAAASVRDLNAKQIAVLRWFGENTGATDYELVLFYEIHSGFNDEWPEGDGPNPYPLQSESGLRTRRSELVKRKFLTAGETFGQTPSGRKAHKWFITRKGREYLEALDV